MSRVKGALIRLILTVAHMEYCHLLNHGTMYGDCSLSVGMRLL